MKNQRRKSIPLNYKEKKYLFFAPVSVLLGLLLAVSFSLVPAGSAQGSSPVIWQVQTFESDRTGLSNPVGLAFSARANAFHVAEGTGPSETTDLVKLTPFAERAGEARLAAAVQNPINMAYDNQVGRLLILRGNGNQLWEVREGPDGKLDPQTLTHHDIRDLNLQDPQGLAVDATGTLWILDAAAPRLIRLQPEAGGDLEAASISEVGLGVASPHGIAFDAASGNLQMMVPSEHRLYEVNQAGEVLNVRDLAQFNLQQPQGMVFAPSGDQTDDPAELDLYVADSAADPQSTGQIVELSLTATAAEAVAAPPFTSSLIRTTDMAAISPPSPDPSGITYLPTSNTLLIVDGEVEETINGITHWEGANGWELTLAGSKVGTTNISTRAPTETSMTDEPTGVTWNPGNGHYFVSDDDARRVYHLDPGEDELIGTADDTWTFFGTGSVGNQDPEGITFDTWNNRLFVADGVNREVYQYSLTGTLINHFDVSVYGVQDPESVEFNAESGTLFVMSSNSATRVIIETSLSGDLLQTIDISDSQVTTAAGLAYAPASNGSGAMRFYIVDRGIDNNNNPNIVDGKMYELSAPASAIATATWTSTSTPTNTRTPTPTKTATPTATATATQTSTATNLPIVPANPTFSDVPAGYWAFSFIERLYAAGITGGCSLNPPSYCPEDSVTRAQMAVFLLRGIHGASYSPPAVGNGTGFADVPPDYWAAAFIKQLAAEGITTGCGNGNYCPEQSVTRAQMAVFLLRSKHGASYVPPGVGAGTGFGDVAPEYWAAAFIKQLVTEGITAGCGNGNYCPEDSVTRAQMAVFLVRTFNLP